MHKLRLIARLDVKNEFVIKGIHLEGLRKIGNPNVLAKKYYDEGIDEIVFMDAVASLYGRNNLFNIIEQACREVFIPIAIGGGIRSLEDIELALRAGADKIVLNTQAVKTPQIISEASRVYGSQCIVASIEAKFKGTNRWEVYVDNGREETGLDVIEWAKKLEDLGVGEIMVTSIDQEGTKKGFDLDLIDQVSNVVSVPVIASGGAGKINHIVELKKKTTVSAVAVASLIHYNIHSISEIKESVISQDIHMRL
ncbi:imidazole glycerol phosphate synthase subunit HisF [Roseivirga echinicomitans]|uniref:imidazole glycerol-phosphate synthase n=1 Tax=Roseivirga echinicomitans TaxID=296218 RepID=A0A150XW21_9BACT|nr:imidazole glycerol phosphate synthase cyclase subunit [Roseivirga echinicomitans]KYG82842.1 imidazole glycerol phosphate synthase cyclase subunit [Roseivirga echinicomitans]